MQNYTAQLLPGAGLTMGLTLAALGLAILLSILAGLARMSSLRIVHLAAGIYIEFFRGTSLLVQLFWIFFVLPLLGLPLSAFQAAIVGLGLNFGAYGAEIVRSSLASVDRGQHEAAWAIGLGPWRSFIDVVVPQALPLAVPAFSNLSIELLKATSLASLLGLSELMFSAYQLNVATLQTVPIFGLLALFYLALAGAITAAFRWFEWRVAAYLRAG